MAVLESPGWERAGHEGARAEGSVAGTVLVSEDGGWSQSLSQRLNAPGMEYVPKDERSYSSL